MKIIKFHDKKLTVNKIKKILNNENVIFTVYPTKSNLKNIFKKIKKLLDYNFKIYSTVSNSYIEVYNRSIYFNIQDINLPDSQVLLDFIETCDLNNDSNKLEYKDLLFHFNIYKFLEYTIDQIKWES